MGTTSRPVRWPWHVAIGGLLAVGVVGAGAAWYRVQPMFDAEELEQANGELDAERRALLAWTCARTPLGDARPSDQAAFDALVFGERWAACRQLAGEEGVFAHAVDEAGHTYDWDAEQGDLDAAPPPVPNALYMAPWPPSARSTTVDAAEAACDGLEDEVLRLAASPDLCTPARPEPTGWDLDAPMLPMIQTAKAVAVRARRLARREGAFAGLELLVHAIAVARDFRRGPANLIAAMISIASERILVGHAASLLLADPAMSPEQYAALDAALVTHLRDSPEPHRIWRAERNAFAENGAGGGASDPDGAALVRMTSAGLDLDWCRAGASLESCLVALREREVATDDPPVLGLTVFGPRASREAMLDWSREQLVGSYATYAARMLLADSNLGQLRAALAWSEARSQQDECPPAVESSAMRLRDEPIDVVPIGGVLFELRAPPLRAAPGSERTVMTLSCPAVEAVWFDDDGEAVPAVTPASLLMEAEASPTEPEAPGATR